MSTLRSLKTFVARNKVNFLIGIAAMAIAPAWRYASRRRLERKENARKQPRPLGHPPPQSNKREIYHAPSIPAENLSRH